MIPAKRKSIVKLKFKCLSASWQKLCQCVNLTDPGGHSASLSYINNNMKKRAVGLLRNQFGVQLVLGTIKPNKTVFQIYIKSNWRNSAFKSILK